MSNILVLGGTGAMGMHLVQLLSEMGDKVSVTTRAVHHSSGNIEYIKGDAKDDKFLEFILARKWDTIVDFMVYSTSEFEQRMLRLLSATTQYIFLSSARVYADSSEPIKEDSLRLLDSSVDHEFLSTDEYSLTKARQEDLLRHSGSDNWTIIRPYITYSEQRLQLGVLEKEGWLYRALKGRAIVFSEDMMTKLTTLTYGFDVARAMASLVGQSRALREVYQIMQTTPVSWHNVLDIYLSVIEKYLSKRPKVLLLDIQNFSRCKPAEYQIKYDRMFNRTFSCEKIADYVSVNDFLPYEQGLKLCLDECLAKPQFKAIDWRSEAIKDRYSGEMTHLDEVSGWKHKIKYLFYRFIKS